jgi:hypothetical protein
MKNGQHHVSLIDNPAFTVRRHLLHAKDDNIQLEQMKKV